jgi:predicted RNase H-like HicB family nuclease
MAINYLGHDEGLEGAYNAGRTQMTGIRMRYAIVIEKAEGNYAAYVPDLPGCVATGATIEDTERSIREAIEFHVEGLRADGLPIPEPSSRVEYVDVAA